MKKSPLQYFALFVFLSGSPALAEKGPLPEFTFHGVTLHPDDLSFSPNDDLIHPTIVKTEGRIENALGKYYLYHAPHKHIATSMAYSDSLDGPWTEYEGNPVVEGPSAPEIRWMTEHGKFFLWGHRKNSQTELWTSEDGVTFDYHSVSITAANIGTRNATYNRVYEYPLQKYGSRYIMLYSGFIEGPEPETGIRCIWLAHSRNGMSWTQLKEPLVEPIEGDMNDLYGPAFLQWQGRNFVTFQDHTSWRGGNLKYVELDGELNPVGAGGERFVLVDPPAGPPLNDRLRGSEFYLEGDTLYLYSSASKAPRLIVRATTKVNPADIKLFDPTDAPTLPDSDKRGPESSEESPTKKGKPDKMNKAERKAAEAATKEKTPTGSAPTAETKKADSIEDLLAGTTLETVYETSFDKPLRWIREAELTGGGKTYTHEPAKEVDWVLEGPGEVTAIDGRMVFTNSDTGNAVVWNTREFPENFIAEWDFRHHHAQGTAIIFFSAQGENGGSIYTPGLPQRTGNFGNYTRGKIHTYHTSYSATNEEGVPRGQTHLKKDIADDTLGKGGKLGAGPSLIDGVTGKDHQVRLVKIGNRIILEVNGVISVDCIDDGEMGGPHFKGGQIGFRQMRHTLEASYGHFKVQRIRFDSKPPQSAVSAAKLAPNKLPKSTKRYPSVEELPVLTKLADPFQFYDSERRVKTRADWEERREDILQLLKHYSRGAAFPQTYDAKIDRLEETEAYDGKATHYSVNLTLGPEHQITGRFEALVPNTEGPKPFIFYICPRSEYAEETEPWREAIIDRGYGFVWLIPGQFNGYDDAGPVKDAFPEIEGNTMMAWVWGINEVIHFVESQHEVDKVIVTGTSRFGKTASATGVANERVDLTVPVTGGFAVELFNLTNNKMTSEQMDKKCYANDVMTTFAGQLEKLPVDQHLVGALIAPRGYLGIMGAENDKKNLAHIEAYEALAPVYEWLGVGNKLGLYDHSPHGHGICEDDFHTIMDFSDQLFYGKQPKSGKQFDQIRNPDFVGFDWGTPGE